MERIEIDNGWCALEEMVLDKKNQIKKCVHCKKNLKIGETIVLLINNYTIFPNCIIHKDCLEELGGPEECIKALKDRFEKFKSLKKQLDKLRF